MHLNHDRIIKITSTNYNHPIRAGRGTTKSWWAKWTHKKWAVFHSLCTTVEVHASLENTQNREPPETYHLYSFLGPLQKILQVTTIV